jgi:hypothetical protein
MRINCTLFSCNHKVQANRAADNTFADHFLDCACEGQFMGSIIANAKTSPRTILGCGLGSEWYSCDRKQQRAKHAPCDQTSGSSGNTAPHCFAPQIQLSVIVSELGLDSLSPNVGDQTWES